MDSMHKKALTSLSSLGFLLEVGDLTYSNNTLYMQIDPRSYQKYGFVMYCRVCFWGSSQRKWVNGFSCRHNLSPMDSYPISGRIQQLDRSSLQQPWSMALVSRGCSGHDTALCERGQVTSFSMMTSTLLLAVVASTNRRLFPSICSTASAMFSVQPKRRRKSQPRTQRFPLTVKCVPSAAGKLPLRHGSDGIPDCTSVTAEPVSISIFVGHPSIFCLSLLPSGHCHGTDLFES
ncbi:hypothetical protein T12_3339 [Trichinella patagoniensis]|uniref:Uncharacterized protein n=1 Tax=Trichinella patagoniensis TaxID=990121 RepID=A0A0V0Z825_9BILA|nr:hypothetical protein T12_3339 [Trichinella patagoniensis]